MTTQTKKQTGAPMRRSTKPAARPATRKPRISAKNRAAMRVLDSFMNCSEEEAQDQRETMAFLEKALDEDRPGYRKLFPKNEDEREDAR